MKVELSNKEPFGVIKQVTTTLIEIVPFDKFKSILMENKPKTIFNPEHSATEPLWYITEYIDDHSIKFYANNWYNKKPMEMTYESLYASWKMQHLELCFFE